MSECQVSQTHVKRPKNIFMQEIFLMQQQNIWLELEMNRFTMIARLVRLNRDLVSGWVVVTKKRQGAGKSGGGRSGLWDEDYLQLELDQDQDQDQGWLLLKKASREKWIWALWALGLLAAGARACDSRANQSAAES